MRSSGRKRPENKWSSYSSISKLLKQICDRDGTIVEYGVTRFSAEMMELFFESMDNEQ